MAEQYWAEIDLRIEEIKIGLRVTQGNRSYLSEGWCVEQVAPLVEIAVEYCFPCAWTRNHPQDRFFYNGKTPPVKPIHHVMFSKTIDTPWVFGLAKEVRNLPPREYTFNKKYISCAREAGMTVEPSKWGSHDFRVDIKFAPKVLKRIQQI